ncbi:universal stress protein [Klebsiella quasipneumoniae subsp. similipneumoniae]|uniref:universal stress protein n=1 Tax=Klebsiella quasipneumoniae TaxID=1463165 RepID=UPI003BF76AFD
MPAFEWVHVQLHQQKGMISLSPPTICNSATFSPALTRGFISDARKMEDYLVNNSKEKLAELINKLSLKESDVQIHIRSGNVRDEVTKLADELKADVVIIGSRNPNIQTHLLGSEAASIVRYAHVPVFVVR